jgi:hypothetical protein
MDLIPAAGNLPEWGALGIALREVIRAKRDAREMDFPSLLEDATGLSPEDLIRTVEQSDELAEIVATSWNAANRSPDERKRRLLVKAAAAGLDGDEFVRVDDVPLFVRTIDELEAVHMKLMRVLLTERNYQGLPVMGAMPISMIVEEWPGIDGSVEPLVAMLVREGLVRDVSVPGAVGAVGPQWSLSPYGERFYGFVMASVPEITE